MMPVTTSSTEIIARVSIISQDENIIPDASLTYLLRQMLTPSSGETRGGGYISLWSFRMRLVALGIFHLFGEVMGDVCLFLEIYLIYLSILRMDPCEKRSIELELTSNLNAK